jgi:hypothetical protein
VCQRDQTILEEPSEHTANEAVNQDDQPSRLEAALPFGDRQEPAKDRLADSLLEIG